MNTNITVQICINMCKRRKTSYNSTERSEETVQMSRMHIGELKIVCIGHTDVKKRANAQKIRGTEQMNEKAQVQITC